MEDENVILKPIRITSTSRVKTGGMLTDFKNDKSDRIKLLAYKTLTESKAVGSCKVKNNPKSRKYSN